MVLLVPASVSAQLGALASQRLPARTLRRTFAFLLVATVGAIAWDLLTWYIGLPTSSSHALVGGLRFSLGTAREGIKGGGY
jgi:phosphate/sulfate permease